MSDPFSCFSVKKPIIAMLHLKGTDAEDVHARAVREFELYRDGGVDAVMVEPYFGTYTQMERMLAYLKEHADGMPYGVNCLNVDAMAFELAAKYDCAFVQVDSVVGHVKPRDEESLQAFFDTFRKRCPKAFLLGGVRFKYQPLLSVKTLEEDLQTAMTRCDVIGVTQNATGEETSMERILRFRKELGSFPLFICAGLRDDNVKEQLRIGDGAVVGSFFKDTYKDDGEVDPEHIRRFMTEVYALRKELLCNG
jgi:predicted TIM-barrel enzyme